MFAAAGGAHQATYGGGGGGANLVSAAEVATSPAGDTTATWTTEEPGTSVVRLGTSPSDLSTRVSLRGRTSDHLAELDGLRAGDPLLLPARAHADRAAPSPPGLRRTPRRRPSPPPEPTDVLPGSAPLRVVPMPDGTARVTWRTDEPATSDVRLGRAGGPRRGVGFDDRLVRRHAVVVTGLARQQRPRRAGRARATPPATPCEDGRRRSGRRLEAWRCSPSRTSGPAPPTDSCRSRTGTWDHSRCERRGSGSYTSRVVDSGRKATWQRLVLDADQPRGTRVVVRVRTGDRPTPDSTWSGWVLAADASRLDLDGRYVQYTVHLSATSRALPQVRAIGITRSGGGSAVERALTPTSELVEQPGRAHRHRAEARTSALQRSGRRSPR